MNTETIAIIFIAVFGLFFSIIGYFIARTISNTRDDIKSLFKNDEDQKKCLSDFKLEVTKSYMTKDECEKRDALLRLAHGNQP